MARLKICICIMSEVRDMKRAKNFNKRKIRQRMETAQRIKKCCIRWVVSIRWRIFLLCLSCMGLSPALSACGPSEIKPVDIYPEDMCSQCRMAISEPAFASEIITTGGEVFKFDDLGCMATFKEKSGALKIAATFVKDYETKNWLPYEHSTIILTSLQTPMGSGKAAFADSAQARKHLAKFPARE